MKTLIKNVIIVKENEKFSGCLLIDEGKICQISKEEICRTDYQVIDGNQCYLAPGMIDIHLHGSYGYDFINEPEKVLDIISKGLIKEGTTSFLASLTVVSHQDALKLLKNYGGLQSPEEGAHFIGVHYEGPYLSVEKKALMDETYLRDPSIEELDEMLSVANGKLLYMTIAPERDGMKQFIEYGKDKLVLMIGHTMATSQQASEALQLGCKGFTHLYNAMLQHQHRQPGAVTAALNSKDAYSELIVDGNHIHPDVIKATYRTLTSEQIILITDAMLAKGMDDGVYTFSNLECKKTGDQIHVIKNGIFAGSVITQLDAIKHMRDFCQCDVVDLFKMASRNPAKLLNLHSKGTIEEGKDADLILLDKDLNLKATFISGKQVY